MVKRIWNIDGKDCFGSEGAVIEWDDDRYFTISFSGNSYSGEILEEASESNMLRVKINHREFEVRKKGELDELIAALGLDRPKVKKLKQLVAPMPGRIVQLSVSPGDSLEQGNEILSLEAMKMENILKAEGIGVVKEIKVSVNDIVEKGDVLIVFE